MAGKKIERRRRQFLASHRAPRFAQHLFVATLAWLTLLTWQAAAMAQDAPLIKRLDGPTRARVLAALAGLIILGFALVLLTWLGARVTQRYRKGTSYHRPTSRPGEHDWARKPLTPDETGED